MPEPHLWIIAGPNGAGKTTLVQSGPLAKLLSACEFINPDAITLEYLAGEGVNSWQDASEELLHTMFVRAAEDARHLLEKRINAGAAVAVESVLSTSKYCSLVERVLELKGKLMLIYVALDSPQKSMARVRQRVLEGGHDVPSEKLVRRWSASLELLPWFVSRAHRFWILDNSEAAVHAGEQPLLSGCESSVKLHVLPAQSLRPAVSKVINEHAAKAPAGQWRFELAADPVLSA